MTDCLFQKICSDTPPPTLEVEHGRASCRSRMASPSAARLVAPRAATRGLGYRSPTYKYAMPTHLHLTSAPPPLWHEAKTIQWRTSSERRGGCRSLMHDSIRDQGLGSGQCQPKTSVERPPGGAATLVDVRSAAAPHGDRFICDGVGAPFCCGEPSGCARGRGDASRRMARPGIACGRDGGRGELGRPCGSFGRGEPSRRMGFPGSDVATGVRCGIGCCCCCCCCCWLTCCCRAAPPRRGCCRHLCAAAR